MPSESARPTRYRYPVAVHLFFLRGNRVLLSRRYQTGWRDGEYSVPAGHVEPGESVTATAIREAREEAGADLSPADLTFAHVMHRQSDSERIDFFFVASGWRTEPVNTEPEKCDELGWYDCSALPVSTIPYVRRALECVLGGVIYSEFGW